jgi:hypothetical protein
LQGFDSVEGRFHAEFPTKPTETQRREDGVTHHLVESRREFPQETYFVHYWNLDERPTGEAAIQKAFDDAVTRFLSNYPGSVQEARTTALHDGYPATDLYISHSDGTSTAVRFILDGRRLYVVGITGPGLVPDSQRLAQFRQAFKIKPAGVPLGKPRPPGRKGK